mgnify:CR=1 FL=1
MTRTLSLVATVTNASPYALRSVSVTSGGDDPYRPYTCPQTTLAPGESMTCTLERLAPLPGRIAWAAAEVRGVYEDGPVGPRTQSADSYAHVDAPATDTGLALRKSINGDDANTAPGVAVAPGSTMAITFEVTNTSANPLHDIKVTDDTIGASDISCPSSYLEAGTSMTCTATLPAPAPGTTHTDHGYVIGNDYVDFWYATDVAHAWSVGAPVDTTTVPSGPWTLPNAPITVPAAATAPVSTTTLTAGSAAAFASAASHCRIMATVNALRRSGRFNSNVAMPCASTLSLIISAGAASSVGMASSSWCVSMRCDDTSAPWCYASGGLV